MAENELIPNLQKVLASAEINNCIVRGLRQSCQAMESNFGDDFSKRAALCVLAKDVDNQDYQKLVRALAKDRQVPILEVDSKVELGQWSGLCKYDQTDTARKIRACGVLVITQFPADQEASAEIIKQYLASN